jgi:hypothetical protein
MSQYANEYDYLISTLTDEVDSVKEHLAANGAKDIEEYRRLCGVVQGLSLAKDIIKDLAKRLEQDADE